MLPDNLFREAHFITPNTHYKPGFVATTSYYPNLHRVEYRVLISYEVTRAVVNFNLN